VNTPDSIDGVELATLGAFYLRYLYFLLFECHTDSSSKALMAAVEKLVLLP